VPLFGEIRFNPVVSLTALTLIWAFVIICAHYKEEVPFQVWRGWIVNNFTWLYIGSQDVWAVFAVMLYFSKYSNLKMGKDDDKPEYSDPTWFMMLFACGIGTGLFFFGVAEPLYHYTGKNRYSSDPMRPDNLLAQDAMNLTLYHWGIHGWIVYSLVGLLLGLLSYREGLPMTMKSCFYPLIGDRVFGWMGDLIDVISIITTLFGVCTRSSVSHRERKITANVSLLIG
jgi:choline-glycine betaine transporter